MKAKLYAQQTRKAVHVKVGAESQKGGTRGSQDSGVGKDSSLHQQFVKDMSSITQMGILNIENESLNRISPVKRDASQNLSTKIIEEVSEEDLSQSAASLKKERKPAFLADQEQNYNVGPGKPPIGKGIKAGGEEAAGKTQNPLLKIYQRIDQDQLEKHGLGHKSELESETGVLNSAYQFSML